MDEIKELHVDTESSNLSKIDETNELPVDTEPSNSSSLYEVKELLLDTEPSNSSALDQVDQVDTEPSNSSALDQVDRVETESSELSTLDEVKVETESSELSTLDEVKVETESSNSSAMDRVDQVETESSNSSAMDQVDQVETESSDLSTLDEVDEVKVETESSKLDEVDEVKVETESSNSSAMDQVDEVKVETESSKLDETTEVSVETESCKLSEVDEVKELAVEIDSSELSTLDEVKVETESSNSSAMDEVKLEKEYSNLSKMDEVDEVKVETESFNCLTFVIVYCGQFKKMGIFIENMLNLYNGKYNIMYNIVTSKLDKNIEDVLQEKNINFKLFNTINEAISNSDNEIVIFQDMVTLHKNSSILETILSELELADVLCMTKTISNEKIISDFKNIIYENKLSDIICLKKSTYITTPGFLLDMNYIRKNTNYKLTLTDEIEYMFPSKIPKKLHFYWDNSKGCYLTNLAIKTFIYNNPHWEINLWSPKLPYTENNIWEKEEFIPPHSINYDDYDYLDYEYLKSLGVNMCTIDFFDLKLKKNMSEVTKSDIFRWKTLSTIGGVWSDLDILFVEKIEKTNFDMYDCNYNELDTVISQYDRLLDGTNTRIDFYYIGLLMSSPNNEFFKIMYDQSLHNIIEESYQGVGGDLMKKHFGLYDNIKNIVPNINYCNLNSHSVYRYWWGDLKDMFINNSQPDIQDFMLHNNDIIGYHWFRGVHLSKIYILFMNYEKKLQNYNFNGPVPKWTNYYKNVFNDFHLNTQQKKISIVMGYVDRKEQLYVTLNTILKTKHTNYEVIIVNDDTVNINSIKTDFPTIDIKIINNSDKKHINPCITYNIGVEHSSGEIILLQNPECCHVGDILTVINVLLKQNDYLAFSTFFLDNFSKNQKIKNLIFDNNDDFWSIKKIKDLLQYTLDNKSNELNPNTHGWASHHFYNKNYLHFCSAIHKNDFQRIGGFTEEYKDGICFDDDDLVRKIMCNNFNLRYFCIPQLPNSYPTLAEHSVFTFHQHHNHFSYGDKDIKIKWQKNKTLFIESNIKHIQNYLTIKYVDKPLSNNYSLDLKNITLLSYDNNYYYIDVHQLDNLIEILPFTERNFEYIFNGKRLQITNNLSEIINSSKCKIDITIDLDTLQQNITFQGNVNNKFKIIIDRIGKARIKVDYFLTEISNNDNTILTDIS